MNFRPSIITRVDLSADRTIQAGDSITVFGIIFANSSGFDAEIDVSDGNGTKKITMTVRSHDSRFIDVPFVADNGLRIDSIGSDQVYVTVFHSQGGS